jgi:hypothetical protein
MTAAFTVAPTGRPGLIVADWKRNGREVIRVALDQFNGCQTINGRIWHRDSEEFKSGRGGLTLGLRHLPALADAVGNALAKARELELLDDTHDNINSRDGGGL